MNKKQKISFANAIITLCLVVSLIITGSVLWEYHRLGEVLPAGVLTALLGLWGGELLIIAVRQIFGSDVPGRTKKVDSGENYP